MSCVFCTVCVCEFAEIATLTLRILCSLDAQFQIMGVRFDFVCN